MSIEKKIDSLPDFNRIRMRLPDNFRFFSTITEENLVELPKKKSAILFDVLHSLTVCPVVLTPFSSMTTSPGTN